MVFRLIIFLYPLSALNQFYWVENNDSDKIFRPFAFTPDDSSQSAMKTQAVGSGLDFRAGIISRTLKMKEKFQSLFNPGGKYFGR